MSGYNEWRIVEKKNHLAVHQLFGQSESSARRFLAETVPIYCNRKYYMDKTLTPDDFEVLGPAPTKKAQS